MGLDLLSAPLKLHVREDRVSSEFDLAIGYLEAVATLVEL
jgi:hypothetical protein